MYAVHRRVLPYHEAIRDDLRAEAMVEFLRPVQQRTTAASSTSSNIAARQRAEAPLPGEAQPDLEPQSVGRLAEEGEEVPLVLVATDRTSRGEAAARAGTGVGPCSLPLP